MVYYYYYRHMLSFVFQLQLRRWCAHACPLCVGDVLTHVLCVLVVSSCVSSVAGREQHQRGRQRRGAARGSVAGVVVSKDLCSQRHNIVK